MAFSRDGERLALASHDGTVSVWDAAIGRRTHTLAAHAGGVANVTFSHDGKRLATAGARTRP